MSTEDALSFHAKHEAAPVENGIQDLGMHLRQHYEHAAEIRGNLTALQQEGELNKQHIEDILSALKAFRTKNDQVGLTSMAEVSDNSTDKLGYFHQQADKIQDSIEEFHAIKKKLGRRLVANGKALKRYEQENRELLHKLQQARNRIQKNKQREQSLTQALAMKNTHNAALIREVAIKNRQIKRLSAGKEAAAKTIKGSQPNVETHSRLPADKNSPKPGKTSRQDSDGMNRVNRGWWFKMFGLTNNEKKEAEFLKKTEHLSEAISSLQKDMQEHKQLFEHLLGKLQKDGAFSAAQQGEAEKTIHQLRQQEQRYLEQIRSKDRMISQLQANSSALQQRNTGSPPQAASTPFRYAGNGTNTRKPNRSWQTPASQRNRSQQRPSVQTDPKGQELLKRMYPNMQSSSGSTFNPLKYSR